MKAELSINEDVFNLVHRNFDLNHRNLYVGHQNPFGAGIIIDDIKPLHILQFVVSGSGSYYLSGQGFYPIHKGMVFYLPKGEKVSYWPNASDPYEYYYLGMDVLEGETFFKQIGFSKENPIARFDDPSVTETVEAIYKHFKEQTLAGGFAGLSEVYKLFELLSKSNSLQAIERIGDNSYVESAILYINALYANDIDVSEIADSVGLNRSYFSILFKKYTGVSVSQYLTEVRVTQACRLLATDRTITEVANLCGFNSVTRLGIHFKKLMKMTPLEYKKYLRNK